jgi:hypothetical protein
METGFRCPFCKTATPPIMEQSKTWLAVRFALLGLGAGLILAGGVALLLDFEIGEPWIIGGVFSLLCGAATFSRNPKQHRCAACGIRLD